MRKQLITSLSVLLVLFSISGCIKLATADKSVYPRTPGDEVMFGTAAIEYSGPSFKSSYSGEVVSGYERIDWSEGDAIRIFCSEASEPSSKFEEYFIKTGSVLASGKNSNATIDHDHNSVGLRWGTGIHNFYALYPSPAEVSTNSLSEGSASFKVESTQSPLSVSKDNATGNWTAVPDLKRNLPMVAVTKGMQSAIEDQAVFLSFVPATTAIQFTLKNGYEGAGDMKLVSVALSSSTTDLNGIVTADLAGWNSGYPACSVASAAKTITVPFGTVSSPVAVAYGKTITFTVFLQPSVDATDLKLSVTTTKDNSTTQTISTALSSGDSTPLSFDAFKKHFVNGILVPEGISWIEIGSLTVADWRTGFSGGEKDVLFKM